MKNLIILYLSLLTGLLSAQEDMVATAPSFAMNALAVETLNQDKDIKVFINQMEHGITWIYFLGDFCTWTIESDKPYFSTEQCKEEFLRDLSDARTQVLAIKQAVINEIQAALQLHCVSPDNCIACKQLHKQLQTFETACAIACEKFVAVEVAIKKVPVLDISSIQDSHTRDLSIMVAQMDFEFWKYKLLHDLIHLARDKKSLLLIPLTDDDKLSVGFLGMLVGIAITESARKTTLAGMAKLDECYGTQSNSILCDQLRKQLDTFEIAVNNALREGGDYIADLINQLETEQN